MEFEKIISDSGDKIKDIGSKIKKNPMLAIVGVGSLGLITYMYFSSKNKNENVVESSEISNTPTSADYSDMASYSADATQSNNETTASIAQSFIDTLNDQQTQFNDTVTSMIENQKEIDDMQTASINDSIVALQQQKDNLAASLNHQTENIDILTNAVKNNASFVTAEATQKAIEKSREEANNQLVTQSIQAANIAKSTNTNSDVFISVLVPEKGATSKTTTSGVSTGSSSSSSKSSSSKSTSSKSTSSKSSTKLPVIDNYKGSSIVDALKSEGVNSSFANREKLAKEVGIKNYTGTAAQNTKLLNALKK
jgi:hypothetical protein